MCFLPRFFEYVAHFLNDFVSICENHKILFADGRAMKKFLHTKLKFCKQKFTTQTFIYCLSILSISDGEEKWQQVYEQRLTELGRFCEDDFMTPEVNFFIKQFKRFIANFLRAAE